MIFLCHFVRFSWIFFGGIVLLWSLPPRIRIRIRIRIHMDIFWIPDPDPHNNRCGSATLESTHLFCYFKLILVQNCQKHLCSTYIDVCPAAYGAASSSGSCSWPATPTSGQLWVRRQTWPAWWDIPVFSIYLGFLLFCLSQTGQ